VRTRFHVTGIVQGVTRLPFGFEFTMEVTGADAVATGTGSMTGASPTAAADANYRVPTKNEWYTAVYYGFGGYFTCATQSTNKAPRDTITNLCVVFPTG